MLLVFILLSLVPVGLCSCSWRWEWSFNNPSPGATSPPLSPSCLIHQSDSVLLINSGSEIMHLFRATATTFDTCESSTLIGQIIDPNSTYILPLSHQDSEVRLISQSRRGSCLKTHFSLTNYTQNSCLTPLCATTAPCFRHLSLPFSDSQSDLECSLAPHDWIILENTQIHKTNFSIIFEGNSCFSNFSIKIDSNETLAIPLPLIPQSDVLFSDATQNCSHRQVHIYPLHFCAPNLCLSMLPSSADRFMGPLAISLMSLALLLAGVSFLLALCLRRKQKIASEECPPPPGETSGHFEMKQEGKLVKAPEVKTRKKSGPVSSPATQETPQPQAADPVRQSIILEKRSSQFSELLSKFN